MGKARWGGRQAQAGTGTGTGTGKEPRAACLGWATVCGRARATHGKRALQNVFCTAKRRGGLETASLVSFSGARRYAVKTKVSVSVADGQATMH